MTYDQCSECENKNHIHFNAVLKKVVCKDMRATVSEKRKCSRFCFQLHHDLKER